MSQHFDLLLGTFFCVRQDEATSLIAASRNGSEAMVRLLLGHEADPNVTDKVLHKLKNVLLYYIVYYIYMYKYMYIYI